MITLRNIYIGALFFLTQITFTLYLPTLPKLADVFLVDQNDIMFTLTVVLIGYAAGHLFWGTASDYFGRKKMIVVSLCLYAAFQIPVVRTHYYPLLLTCFGLIGFCAAAFTSVGNALLKDLFPTNVKKAIAIVGIVMAIGPSVGPFIGAHLLAWFSWSAVYVFLFIYAVINVLGIVFLLKTDNQPHLKPKRDHAWLALKAILSNRDYLGEVLPLSLMFGLLFGYLGASPFIFMHHFHLSLSQYAYVSFATTITGAIGSIINARLVMSHSPQWVSLRGVICSTVASVLILLLILMNIEALIIYMVLFALMTLGIGMSLASCKAGAMMVFDKNVGMASSLMKFIQTLGSITITALAAMLYSDNAIKSMVILLAVTSAVALLLILTVRPKSVI
jgi:MFS transporter, DHA1 family, multidrug resistance protein